MKKLLPDGVQVELEDPHFPGAAHKNWNLSIMDANWLLMSRFSIMSDQFESNMPEQVKLQAQSNLQDLMAKSITIVLNRFPIIDNIVIVTDNRKGNEDESKNRKSKYEAGIAGVYFEQCKYSR